LYILIHGNGGGEKKKNGSQQPCHCSTTTINKTQAAFATVLRPANGAPLPALRLDRARRLYAHPRAPLCNGCHAIMYIFKKKMAEKHQTKTYQQGGMVLLMLHANSMVLRNLQK
jgi:hypothetical protein